MLRIKKFGNCSKCGGKLKPILFTEKETIINNGIMSYTGRKRTAISHLLCENCMHKECIDDSFDSDWY